MIALDLDEPTVLRRTLEELEAKQITFTNPMTPLTTLASAATLEEVIVKTNDIINSYNDLITQLNATDTTKLN